MTMVHEAEGRASHSAAAPAIKPVLVKVPPDGIDHIWPMIDEDFIEPLCDRHPDLYEAGGLIRRVEDASLQLWLAWDPVARVVLAVAGTEIVVGLDGTKRLATIFCTGEDRQLWQGLYADIEGWAKQEGCHKAAFWARPGWNLPGYRVTHVMLEKVL